MRDKVAENFPTIFSGRNASGVTCAVAMHNDDRGVWMQWTEAAMLLGIRPGHILSVIEAGQLPAEETESGLLMVRRADVERLRDGGPVRQRVLTPPTPSRRLPVR